METVQRGNAARSLSNIPRYADGGVVQPFTVRGVMNRAKSLFASEPETMTQKYARQDAEFIAKNPKYFQNGKVPVTESADQKAITQYASGNRLDERMKEQGLADGGEVKAGIIRGKGTGTSDSIKGKMQPGSFVMPKDSTDVMVSNGETNFTPEMVQKIGTAALMMAKGLTHTPVAKQKPDNYFDDGGVVGEKKKNSFGDAAAASQSSAVSQIPTSGYSPAPVGQRVDSTELGRNVSNAISALPGVAPVMTGTNALLNASRIGALAAATPGAVDRLTPTANAAPTLGVSPTGGAAQKLQPIQPLAPSYGVSQAGAGRGFVNQQTVTPSAPVESPQLNNKVVRDGNSYTGAPNISGDVSFVDPKGKALSTTVSPQSYPAAQVLSERYSSPSRESMPQERGGVNLGDGSGNVGLGYAANLARKNAETGASSIFNSASRQTARDALKCMDGQELAGINNQSSQQIAKLGADTSLANAKLGAETQRQGYGIQAQNNQANQQNAAARLGIDRTTAGLNNQATQQKISAGQQMQDLQTKLLTAKPEERAGIEDNLRALQGKYEKPAVDRFTVVPGGTDGLGNRQASRVLNNQTGQFVDQPTQTALPPKDKLVKGQAYTTPRGQAVWNGSQFTPI